MADNRTERSLDITELSFDAFDEIVSPRHEYTDFDRIVETRMNRRAFVSGSIAVGVAALLAGDGVNNAAEAKAYERGVQFDQIPANTLDTITLPNGFNWHVVASWGDALWSNSMVFDETTGGTGQSQERSFGDNNDGTALFQIQGKNVLVVNNEYTNRRFLHFVSMGRPVNKDDIRKSMAAHGVSIVEIAIKDNIWSIVKDSKFNRRITANTPMEITGPARGHHLLKTAADPKGEVALGTWNNCGNGVTPWGTYLACEENFNGYFSSSNKTFRRTDNMKRYGVTVKDSGYKWASTNERFDIAKHPNEPNRFGYVVEIDPANPNSTPKKRTALGRFKHENAEVVIAKHGYVVVYLGDDERGEFLYRFVSNDKHVAGGNTKDLLDTGLLYVAKFYDDGKGEWVALTPATTGMTEGEIAIKTRIAASKVGATTMDRPEWVAANPRKVEAYCCLTNNKNRGKKPNAGGDKTPLNGPNPRKANRYGQIVRWTPFDDDHAATYFDWDLYVVAGNPTVYSNAYAGSANVNADNMFNAPDGLTIDSNGMLWIQTDGNDKNEGDFRGQGNNQMLVGNPETGEIKRFMVGPNECEITGATWSEDRATLFIGIQHPGAKGNGHFPLGGAHMPKSSIVAIRRDDNRAFG